MEVEESFPTLGGIYYLPGTQINSWLKCGTQSIVDRKSNTYVFANEAGIIVLEKDCNYYANDLKSRNRSLSRVSMNEETLNSLRNLHTKQDQNWISKSLRKLSIASTTSPNLSGAKLNNDKLDTNYLTEDISLATSKSHNRSYSTSSQKEKSTLFQSIRLKIKKNQQYHSNDVLMPNNHDELTIKANRRCSKVGFESLGKKSDIEALINNSKKGKISIQKVEEDMKEPENDFRKEINNSESKPRCFRAGILDSTISKNFVIRGKLVTHKFLPEMDIVCGYVQLEFENEGKIPVFAMLLDYELIFFEDDKCKNEVLRITTETCSAYTEPKSFDIKVEKNDGKSEKSENRKSRIEKNKGEKDNDGDKNEGKTDKSEHRKSKYDKKSENSSKEKEIDDKNKEITEEDFSFIVSSSQGQLKLQTINNSSMIRWMASINTASSNIALALHLSSHREQSDSIFDEDEDDDDNSNFYNKDYSKSVREIYNKEYLALIREFNYNNKVEINKDIIQNNKNEDRLPSPTIHGSPIDLINKNIPIIEVTGKDDGFYNYDSVRKKKNRLSNLEARFNDIKIPEGSNSLENMNSSNFLDCTKLDLNSPIFNMDCQSMPSLNNSKKDNNSLEYDIMKKNKKEKDDIMGDINTFPRNARRPSRAKRMSVATVNTVNTVNSCTSRMDDDICFDENGKFGSSMTSIIYALPERIIEGIWMGEETPDTEFLDILIYTYRHFTSADYIMDKLLIKYQEKLPNNSNSFQEEEFYLWKPIVMIRIANYLKRWLTFCAIDFREPSIRSKLDSFINSLPNISTLDNDDITNSYMIYKDLIFLQKLFNKFIDEVLIEIDLSPVVEAVIDISSLPEFINLDASMVANKLTLLEAKRFQSIKPIEFILNLWYTNDESPYIQHEMKNLKEMVEFSNHISFWVITEILAQRMLKPRVKVLEMFIKIAYICYKKLNNYQTLFSICSGLQHSQITRLKNTWETIQPKYKSRFNDLEKVTSIAKNYISYRQIHANFLEKDKNSSQYIPFIALIIKDLYFYNDGNPKYIDAAKLKKLNNKDNESSSINDSFNPASLSSPGSNHASSLLGTSLKSTENDIASFLTSSTSNYSINQDFGLECIDEVESNSSQFDKDDRQTILEDDDLLEIKIYETKSESDLPAELGPENEIECLTSKVLSIESATSTATITTTSNQKVNFEKLREIMGQIRKIEHCQRQSKNYQFNNTSEPLEEMKLPRNYYQIVNDDKKINKYSLLCEQRQGQPVPMLSKWAEDKK